MSEEKQVKLPINCPICGASNWLNVDEHRLKPEGMCLCTGCGFITYPEIVAKADQLKEFYRKEYRPGPTVQNLFTGQRKLHYHAHFLDEQFKKWKEEKLNAPAVFEVGAAFGMFLNMIKSTFKHATVAGSELTTTFRRVAYHEYDIRLREDFDDTRKWDMIASYKVLEHQANPEKELRRYALSLKEGGVLYISVPTWFHTMVNFGLDGFALEYYYDKNHVNVWTRKLFETLMKKCGLRVVKSNFVFYDSTYLCVRDDEMMKEEPQYESAAEVTELLRRIKKASDLFDSGDFHAALKEFPAYPDAILAAYEKNRAQYHQVFEQGGWPALKKEILEPALNVLPNSHKILFFAADLSMRYDQYEEALDHLNQALVTKPGDAGTIIGIANCFRAMARKSPPGRAAQLIAQARDATRDLNNLSFQHSHEAITWIFQDNARLPIPKEEGAA